MSALPGLADHLRDAIRLNRARRAGYVAVAGWRAAALSRVLVACECLLLPLAHALDRRAARFHAEGVSILAADLACMSQAPDAGTPPVYTGGDAATARRAARRAIRPLLRDAQRDLRHRRFEAAGRGLCEAAATLRRLEADARVHLALAEHVVASAAVAARHGTGYARASGGRTAPLTARIVRGHLALVGLALRLDAAAHGVHARGAGLFVNDLPPIHADDHR